MIDHTERDNDICSAYRAGSTAQQIGSRYKLSRQRVLQIIRLRGIQRDERKRENDRDEFLGVNISDEDKTALRAEAQRRGMSMSALTSEWIQQKLAEKVTHGA